jgi:hypothetical protein
MRYITGYLKDHPTFTNFLLVIIVFLHSVVTYFKWIPNIWEGLIAQPDKSSNVYIAMLTVAALQASFAGVIVVFGLSTQPSAFRQLRIKAGNELVNNWLSISYSGFISAALALVASLVQLTGGAAFAPWFFETSVIFCAHGIVRLLWLLKCLIGIVQRDDVHEAQGLHKK